MYNKLSVLFLLQTLPKVEWYTERSLTNISVGSLMVIVLVRTIQANISQIQVLIFLMFASLLSF